jgi:hypothetical protein
MFIRMVRLDWLVLQSMNYSHHGSFLSQTTLMSQPRFPHYKIFNAQMFAQRIGMNASLLTQYIKATKSPSPQQEKKIINGIRRIGKELSLIEI